MCVNLVVPGGGGVRLFFNIVLLSKWVEVYRGLRLGVELSFEI